MESFFNISVSYREDAGIKTDFYGVLERVKSTTESLTELIEKFGADNRHLAIKSCKEVRLR